MGEYYAQQQQQQQSQYSDAAEFTFTMPDAPEDVNLDLGDFFDFDNQEDIKAQKQAEEGVDEEL